jgi:uncharacterized membrane protein YjjB (DUF3815 family)
LEILLQIVFSFISSAAFGIISNIPRRALFACGVSGAIGWMSYWFATQLGVSIGIANFLGAFLIGFTSIISSRRLKMPTIIFNIPSLVPLVPGAPAYKAIRQIITGQTQKGLDSLVVVLVIAGAIAIAFMMTNLMETIYHLQRQKFTQARKKN